MNLLGTAGMIFLIILNTVFLILGLGLLIIGAIVINKSELVDSDLDPLFEALSGGSLSVSKIIELLGVGLLVLGIFILIVSALGDIGACFKVRPPLITYAVILIILIIAELVIMSLVANFILELNDSMKSSLLSLLSSYEGNSGGALTKAWNILFLQMVDSGGVLTTALSILFPLLDCCGVNAYSVTNDFQSTSWWTSSDRGSDVIPAYCCVSATRDNVDTLNGTACTLSPTSDISFINAGCYDNLNDVFVTVATAVVVIIVIIVLVEGVGAAASFIMVWQISSDIDKKRKSGKVLQAPSDKSGTDNHSNMAMTKLPNTSNGADGDSKNEAGKVV